MKQIPIFSIFLLVMLCFSFSCNDEEILPKSKNITKQKIQEIELDIPQFFNFEMQDKNTQSEWVTLQNSAYSGEIKISTNSEGYINSIKVRGEIANNIEKTYLRDGFGEFASYDENYMPIDWDWDDGGGGTGGSGWRDKLQCMANCLGNADPTPTKLAICIAYCSAFG